VFPLILVLACSPRGEHRLTNVQVSTVSQSSWNTPTREFYTYKATLPKGINVSRYLNHAVVVDREGKEHPLQRASYSENDPGPHTLEATFEVPPHSDPQAIRLDRYRIEVKRGVIIDTQAVR